jgi:hypothetical protein
MRILPRRSATQGEGEFGLLLHLPTCQRICSLCLIAGRTSPLLICLDAAADFFELSLSLIHERQVHIFKTSEIGDMADRCPSSRNLRNIYHLIRRNPKLRLSLVESKSIIALAEEIHGARMRQIWRKKMNKGHLFKLDKYEKDGKYRPDLEDDNRENITED